MTSIGPLYCETPAVGEYVGFFLEPINTLTSLFALLAGVVAVYYIMRHEKRAWDLYALAFLLIVTGIGSVFWHGFRTPAALAFDVFPGIIVFFLFVFLWASALRDRWFGYATVATIIVFQALVMRFADITTRVNASFIVLYFFIALIGMLLVVYTHHRLRGLAWLGFLTLFFAAGAAVFRTIDLAVCNIIPFGTHFLWHLLLSAAALLGIVFLVKLRKNLALLVPKL